MHEHVRTMLEATETDVDQPIGGLPILTERERRTLLFDWNQTVSPYPQRCLHDLIQDQVQRTPDAVAVECGDEGLTYRELDARANQLANHLVGLGVGPGVLVGICVERSLEMLVGLLGTLKAGGAYVPIDPAYPVERQAFMLESSEAPIVLTQERLVEALPPGGFEVVRLDRDWPEISQLPTTAPPSDSDTEQLAYVIYTSGSTGKPKGVQISHRALVNFLWTMRERPGLDGDDVLVAVTTLSFDIAGLELYLPLIVGARIVLARRRDLESARAGEPPGSSRRHRHAGDADHLEDAARFRLAGAHRTEGVVRGRGPAALTRRWPRGARHRALEHVRAHRDHDLVDLQAIGLARGAADHRAADSQHDGLHPRPTHAAGSGGRGW